MRRAAIVQGRTRDVGVSVVLAGRRPAGGGEAVEGLKLLEQSDLLVPELLISKRRCRIRSGVDQRHSQALTAEHQGQERAGNPAAGHHDVINLVRVAHEVASVAPEDLCNEGANYPGLVCFMLNGPILRACRSASGTELSVRMARVGAFRLATEDSSQADRASQARP